MSSTSKWALREGLVAYYSPTENLPYMKTTREHFGGNFETQKRL